MRDIDVKKIKVILLKITNPDGYVKECIAACDRDIALNEQRRKDLQSESDKKYDYPW